MPAAFTVASLALDTGSYMVSGKTLTDHGLSVAMDEDCAMVRLLDEEEAICQAAPAYEIAGAALTPLPEGGDLDIGLASGPGPNGGGYAQLARLVHKARTVQAPYLAAGMLESNG